MESEKIKNYLYYLLSIKDYMENELRSKVLSKFENVEEELLNSAIKYLRENKYIDDEDYIKCYIDNKYKLGYGWNRVIQDLKYKKNLEYSVFEHNKICYDWYESARGLKVRKYGNINNVDYKVLVKQKNYLIRRGFSMEEVEYAFAN